ncbi:MAG: hypothetical protein JJE07_10090 [Flavobacteriaceae bacterium]|nr:hypothetical protein [Flavobacteriaceae bacterium]
MFSVFSIIFLTSFSVITAQSRDLEKLTSEMLLIADNFAAPGAEGAAVQSSAGWFSSARSLDKWQVEVSVYGNALFVPNSKQNKLITNASLGNQHPRESNILNIQGSSNALLPTVFGGDTDVVFEGEINDSNFPFAFKFDAIDGLNKKIIIHPFPQVTVGLPYGTEVALRYVPRVVIDNVGVSTSGIGFKHNFAQYFKYSRPDDFQVAAVVTYSNINIDYAYAPIEISASGVNVLKLNRIDVKADLWLLQALASKLYGDFEVFGAMGVTSSNFDYSMGGGGSLLLPLNNELVALGGNDVKFKADLGFNYYVGNFKISSAFTAGSFFNANLGLHYKI